MRLLIDMDGITCDLTRGCVDMYNVKTGDTVTEAYVDKWDKKFPDGSTLFDYFSQPGFFLDLDPIPGAVEGVKALQDAGHDVVIVSAATMRHAPGEKLEWLKRHMPSMHKRDVIFAARKELVSGDILIDDHTVNATDWVKAHPRGSAVTLAYEYNKHCWAYSRRCADWSEILRWVFNA